MNKFLVFCCNAIPTPIKDASSIQKLFFYPTHYEAFDRICFTFTTGVHTKFRKTHLFWAIYIDATTIQKRPLLAQVR